MVKNIIKYLTGNKPNNDTRVIRICEECGQSFMTKNEYAIHCESCKGIIYEC